MKKKNVHKLLYAVSVLLLLGFCIRVVADYLQYSSSLNSAPFYLWILARVIEFIVPGMIAFIAAGLVKKKYEK